MARDERGTPPGHVPVFNVPGVVLALALTMTAIHAFVAWGPVDAGTILVLFAFLPARGLLAASTGPFPAWVMEGAEWWSYVTYGLLHADWMHLAINVFFMLAFGGFLARRIGAGRFLLLSAAGSAAGALAYLAVHAGEIAVLVGASAAVSAQVAGTARLMFVRPGALRHMGEYENPAASGDEPPGNVTQPPRTVVHPDLDRRQRGFRDYRHRIAGPGAGGLGSPSRRVCSGTSAVCHVRSESRVGKYLGVAFTGG